MRRPTRSQPDRLIAGPVQESDIAHDLVEAFDAEATLGEPLPGLRLIGGVAFIDATLTKTAGGRLNGRTAPGVPENQISLYGEYDLPPWFVRNLTLTGRVLHSAPQFYDQANTQTIPDWTRFDLGLRYVVEGYNGKPVVLRANVENLLDTNYYQTAIDGLLSQGYPRVFLLSAQFDF